MNWARLIFNFMKLQVVQHAQGNDRSLMQQDVLHIHNQDILDEASLGKATLAVGQYSPAV
jgi:hypothetical protein